MTAPAAALAAPEAARDRELRRLDWRFLRPGMTLERVVDPGPAALRAAARAGAGRGVYCEWRRPVLGGGKALRVQLESAGFEEVGLYWPCPGLRRPWFWLPLSSEAAAEYVRATRLPARSSVRRAVDRPLRALWRWAAARERLWPICAAARTPGSPPPAEELLGRIAREWAAWGLGSRPERLTWMLLTRGSRSINKVVGLVFAEPDPAPRVAVKLPRVPEMHDALRREAAALDAVHARVPGGLRGAPRVLFCDERSGGLALGETALAGQPLFSLLTAESYRDLAFRGVDWLADLAGPLAGRTAGAAGAVVEAALRDFAAAFGPVADPAELRATERLVAPLADLPSVLEHRDFSPWNVHVAPDGGLVAYDWESAEPAGLPLTDLVYFLAYLAFFYDRAINRGRCPESYRRARNPGTFTGGVHRDCMARYAARVGLDAGHVRGLHLLTWLIHTRSDYRRFAADAGGPPPVTSLERSLFLALWREELRR
ncbi:MAG: phosphotransferase family protein [Gemmatimonadales bacterium]